MMIFLRSTETPWYCVAAPAGAQRGLRVNRFPVGHAGAGEFFSSQRECVKQDSAVQVIKQQGGVGG